MFTAKMKLNLSLTILTVLVLQFVGNSIVSAADTDIVILVKDPLSTKAQEQLKEGTIESMDYNYLVYENKDGKKRYRPWEIEWIKFGGIDDPADQDSYSSGITLLQNQSWEKAAKVFEKQLKHADGKKTGPVWDVGKKERRAMILYTTYYYHGYAMLQQGLAKQRIATKAYREVLKVFPIGLSRYSKRKRQEDYTKHPDKLEAVKILIKENLDSVSAELAPNGLDEKVSEDISKYLEKIAAVDNTDDLETGVSKFMEVCEGFYKNDFSASISILKEPFIQTSLDSQALDFSKYKPMMFYKIKLAIAQAYFGLREYNMGVAEISGSFNANNVIKPSLKEIVYDVSKGNKGFYNYIIDGYNLVAQSYESKPDYKEAEDYYKEILNTTRNVSGFEAIRNDTKLSIALCQAKKGKTDDAVETLTKLLGEFKTEVKDISRKWEKKNLVDKTQASLYMGVYLTLGEVYYDTFSRSNKKSDIFEAFNAYQKVTSYFAADDLKRAKALHWLNRIAKEIANEYYGNFQNSPGTLPNGKANPYKYYMDLAKQYSEELKKHYPYTEWAQQS